MKSCSTCKTLKVLDDFPRSRNTVDGRHNCCKACEKVRRDKNRNQINSQKRQHYRDNKPKILAKAKVRYHTDIEAGRQRARKYSRSAKSRTWRQQNWQKNRPKLLAYQRRRKRQNPQQFAEYEARRRAKIKGATVIEQISRREIYDANNGCCHICQLPVQFRKMHMDHVVPLSKGGQHTRDNLKPAHPFCNMSKKDRTP